MKRELTERQTELAIVLREATKTPRDEASWGPFTDFMRSVAEVVEGAESLTHPNPMQKRFARCWESYARLWRRVHDQVISDCLGNEEDRVRSHPKGKVIIGRILNRVKEVHGPLTPGMEVNVDIDDILMDELGQKT